jgi:hypothetical protein
MPRCPPPRRVSRESLPAATSLAEEDSGSLAQGAVGAAGSCPFVQGGGAAQPLLCRAPAAGLALGGLQPSSARHHSRELSGGELGRPIHGIIVRVKQCKGLGFEKPSSDKR